MARLSLEQAIHEDFKELGTSNAQEGGEALAKLLSDLAQLDARDKITEPALRSLVSPNSASQARIEEVVRISLSSDHFIRGHVMQMFEQGGSAIVLKADGSEVMAVHHSPNPNPRLERYGNQLRWALQHAGYAAIAGAQHGVSPASPVGYLAVENAIRISRSEDPIRRISDIPPKYRHHLGGDWRTDRPTMKDAIGPVVTATSGVLLNQYFIHQIRLGEAGSTLEGSYMAAVSEGTLDNFDGNFLAGLNDAKVSMNLLNGVFGGTVKAIQLTEMIDLEDDLDGVNLH